MANARKLKVEVMDLINGKKIDSITVPKSIDPEVIEEHLDELVDVFHRKQGEFDSNNSDIKHVKVPVGDKEHSVGLALTGRAKDGLIVRDYTAESERVRDTFEHKGITYTIQDMRITSDYILDKNNPDDAAKIRKMFDNKIGIENAKAAENFVPYNVSPVRFNDVNQYTGQAFKRTVLVKENTKTGSWYFDKGSAPTGPQVAIDGVRVSGKIDKGNAVLTKKSLEYLTKKENLGKAEKVDVLGVDGKVTKEFVSVTPGKTDKDGKVISYKTQVGNPGVDVSFGHAWSRFPVSETFKKRVKGEMKDVKETTHTNVDLNKLEEAVENLQPVKFAGKTYVYVVAPKVDKEGNMSDVQLRRCQYPGEGFDTYIENLAKYEEQVGAEEAAKDEYIKAWRDRVPAGEDPFKGKEAVDLGGPRPFSRSKDNSVEADVKAPKKETAKKAAKKAPVEDKFVETADYGEVSVKYGRNDYVTKEQAEKLLADGGTVERTTQAGKTQTYRFAPMIKYDLDRTTDPVTATPKVGEKPYIGLTTENGVDYAAQALQIAFDDPTGCGFEPKDLSDGFKKLVNEIGSEDLKKSLETFAGATVKKTNTPKPRKQSKSAKKTGAKVKSSKEDTKDKGVETPGE